MDLLPDGESKRQKVEFFENSPETQVSASAHLRPTSITSIFNFYNIESVSDTRFKM